MPAEAPAAGLPPGYLTAGYEIVRVLGAGGFGITCLAFDHHLDGPIKEYYPADLAPRGDGWRVSATAPRSRDVFAWGLERFLASNRDLDVVADEKAPAAAADLGETVRWSVRLPNRATPERRSTSLSRFRPEPCGRLGIVCLL